VKLFLGLWALGAVMSVIIIATNPARTDIGDKTQKLRTASIAAGFIPCFGLSILAQIIYFGLYRASVGHSVATQNKLRSSLSSSFGTPDSGPSTSLPAPKPPTGDNPFL